MRRGARERDGRGAEARDRPPGFPRKARYGRQVGPFRGEVRTRGPCTDGIGGDGMGHGRGGETRMSSGLVTDRWGAGGGWWVGDSEGGLGFA